MTNPVLVRLIEAFLCALFVFSFSLAEGMTVPPETGSPFSVSDSTYRRVIRDGARSMSCYLNYPQGSAKVQPTTVAMERSWTSSTDLSVRFSATV